jgi:hypothetical protein
MALWPFSLIWPGGLVNNQVVTHSELNKLDEQQAQAADGAVWTDVALVRNFFPPSLPPADSGEIVFWDPFRKVWLSCGHLGGAATGAWSIDGSFWEPMTVGSAASWARSWAMASDGAGNIILGGASTGNSQKIRQRNAAFESGVTPTWANRNTVASGSEVVKCATWLSGPNLFVVGLTSSVATNIETSSDGITWTQRTAPNSQARQAVAWNGSIAVMTSFTNTDKCITSVDGINWTERTLPASNTWRSVVWNATRGKWMAIAGSGGVNHIATSVDGITWTSAGLTLPSGADSVPSLVAFGRAWLLKFGALLWFSLDDGVTWTRLATLPVGDLSLAVGENQLLVGDMASGNHYRSLRGGL